MDPAVESGQKSGAEEPRPLCLIAREIRLDWKKPFYGAVPYIGAMAWLKTMGDTIGSDSAMSIVRYFLANASTWRGPVARRIKAELKAMLKT
jgi:hypothetical protein